MRLTATDNILCTLPLHHSYGLGNCLLDAVYAGSALVLLEPEDTPFAAHCNRVLDLIRQESIRCYPGVPYQFQVLADLPNLPRPDLSGLKLCVSSGDVLPRRTYERFLERIGLPIRSLYGLTEAGSIAINTDPAETMQFGSLGRPLCNVEVQIRDGAGQTLPGGESGQIWVRSRVIPPTSYENRPELTKQAFRDGFYNTGDVGMIDARGHLVMLCRKQTFVDVGGHKVDVSEVKEVLQGHPSLREAAALGVDVPGLGTLLKAVVMTNDGCGEGDIVAHCRARLAAFQVPRLIEFRDALPGSPLGKVLKSKLVDDARSSRRSGEPSRTLTSRSGSARRTYQSFDPAELAVQIQEQAALCLQREPALIARSASFQSMGFESLRAAELHQRLVNRTGLPLSITMLWNYPSIDQLAAALWAQMNAQWTGLADEPVRTMQEAKDFDELLGEVDGLSDAEVESTFRAM